MGSVHGVVDHDVTRIRQMDLCISMQQVYLHGSVMVRLLQLLLIVKELRLDIISSARSISKAEPSSACKNVTASTTL